MRKNYIFICLLSLLIILIPLTDYNENLQADENAYYKKVTKGLNYFQKVYERVQSHYVEEIDPYEFVKAGIEGMLGTLDPYTVFIEDEADTRLQIITTGKYGGLGMEIGMRNNQITVISPMDNSPAKKAGIRAGDIISKINGEEVSSISPDKISRRLRGPVGTQIEISIKRPGYANEITMTLTRAEIVIEDVTFFDFIQPGIAYVRLTGFTEKAAAELTQAINDLKKRQEIKAFILDLRGNSGGLLESAVEVAGIFLPKDTPVVSTKGFRDGENTFPTHSDAILPYTPLAVLVDGGSASASEIVAGALQDLDRAILIGTQTFGKGLVQKVYNIDKNSSTKVKVTTAKYYIPSGRCVQKQDYIKNQHLLLSNLTDSTVQGKRVPYYTKNKRMVFEHGGITPDKIIDQNDFDYIITELWRQSLFFNFAVTYHQEHPELIGNLEINQQVFNDFIEYVRNNNFDYQMEGENELNKFSEIAKEKQLGNEIVTRTLELINMLKMIKEEEIINNREKIMGILLEELAEKYYGNKERIKYSLRSDKQLYEAIDILLNSTEYKKILAIN